MKISDTDQVCIVVRPPKPPGPRGPFDGCTIWQTREDGSFQVYTSASTPVLKDVQVLDIGVANVTEDFTAAAASKASPDDYDPEKPVISKREALVIQSDALRIASEALMLQSAALTKQLEAMDSPAKETAD